MSDRHNGGRQLGPVGQDEGHPVAAAESQPVQGRSKLVDDKVDETTVRDCLPTVDRRQGGTARGGDRVHEISEAWTNRRGDLPTDDGPVRPDQVPGGGEDGRFLLMFAVVAEFRVADSRSHLGEEMSGFWEKSI